MLSMSLKTLNILICFDGKKQPSEKNKRKSSAIVVTKNVDRIKN